ALPAGGARSRLLNALADTLAAFALRQPLLLILDDLHWADELSLSFVASLPPDFLRTHGVLLVGTYRAEEVTPALEQVLRAPGVNAMSLPRLDEPTVGVIVGDMLALPEPPRPLVAFLARHSAG